MPRYRWQTRAGGPFLWADTRQNALSRIYRHFADHPYARTSVLLYRDQNGKGFIIHGDVVRQNVNGKRTILYRDEESIFHPLNPDGSLGAGLTYDIVYDEDGFARPIFHYKKK